MSQFVIKRDDLSPKLEATLKDISGAVVDLTTATGVTFRLAKPDGAKVSGAATVEDAAGGVVSYQWASGDTDIIGSYQGEFVVTFPTSLPQTFPSKNYINIEVKENLA